MTLKTMLPELTEGQLAMLHRLISEEVIDQTYNIYITTEMQAKGDLGEDAAKAWDALRLQQRQALAKLFGEGSV